MPSRSFLPFLREIHQLRQYPLEKHVHLGEQESRKALSQGTFAIGLCLTKHDCKYRREVIAEAFEIGEEIWMPPEEAPLIAPSAPKLAS